MAMRRFVSDIYKLAVIVGRLTQITIKDIEIGLQLLDFNNSEQHISRFLSVDAHALQHPEIHGRWSNHFHLTRLNLILGKKQTWNYKKSPILSDYLNAYKLNRPNEFLSIPKPLERGKITAKDLIKATTADECVALIKIWADEVYHSLSSSHSIVSQIADGFLDNIYNGKTHDRKTTNR
jgi:hypothetical protein